MDPNINLALNPNHCLKLKYSI